MKRHFYYRILLFIILSAIIPVITLSGIILFLTRMYQSMTFDYHRVAMDGQKYLCEEPLKYIEKTVIQTMSIGDVSSAIYYRRDTSNYQMLNRVSRQILRVQSYDLDIRNIVLTSLVNQWVLDYDNLQLLGESPYRGRIDSLTQTNSASFWHHDRAAGLVSLVKRLPLNATASAGMIFVDIPVASIESIIRSQTGGQLSMVIKDNHGYPIIGSALNQLIVEEALTDGSLSLTGGEVVRYSYNRKDYILTRIESEYNGWSYYSVIPVSESYQTLEAIQNGSIVVVALAVLLAGVLAYFFSRRLYTPIENIIYSMDNALKKYPPVLAEQGDDLISRVGAMLSRLDEAGRDLKLYSKLHASLFLRDVLEGHAGTVEPADLIRHGITDKNLDDSLMCVVAVRISEDFPDIEERKLWKYALNNVLDEFAEWHGCLPLCVSDAVFYVVYPISPPEHNAQMQVDSFCDTILAAVKQNFSFSVQIGVSMFFSSVREMAKAGEQCRCSLRICMQRRGDTAFYGDALMPDKANLRLAVSSRLKLLLEELESGDVDKCREGIGAFFTDAAALDFGLYKSELARLVCGISDLCRRVSIPVDPQKLQMVLDFDISAPVSTVNGLERFITEEFVVPVCAAIGQGGVLPDAIAEQMAVYISQELENDLSLERCAERLKYNPNYLSRVFRESTGKTFSEYVAEARVGRCKQLLRETGLSISDIAQKLGYQHSQNFIRVFKKYVSMTPGQYRDLHRKACDA